jgi:hypothetical protein
VLALLLAGCASGSHAAAGSAQGKVSLPAAHPRTALTPVPGSAPLSARVVLPSRTMTAGSSMAGHVLVDNRTGHTVRVSGCQNLFAVALTSSTYRPAVAWLLCLQRFTIPVGETRYPVTVLATYLQCSEGGPRDGVIGCPPSGGMPPLPPGTYQARLFQAHKLVRVPPPITVRVTPPGQR